MKLTKVKSQEDFDVAQKSQMDQIWEWWENPECGYYISENDDVVEVKGIEENKKVYLNGDLAFEYFFGSFCNIDWTVTKSLLS